MREEEAQRNSTQRNLDGVRRKRGKERDVQIEKNDRFISLLSCFTPLLGVLSSFWTSIAVVFRHRVCR